MPRCPSPSHAIIDLSAIAANLAVVRKRAGDRKVLFAVKADAYGHGAVEVSRYVEKHRYADWLAVATVAEGQELVEAGITLPILKLSPADPWDMDAAITSGIRLTVVDFDTLEAVSKAAVRLGITAKIHIAVDSGMGRIGLRPECLAELTAAADRAKGVEVEGVFTHLPISDVPEGAEFTRREIDTFMTAVSLIETHRGPFPLVHLANSGAEDDKPYWCEGQSSRSVGFLGQQHEDEHEEHQHGPAHAATSRHGVLRCSMGCGSNPAVFHVADDDHAPDEDE